MSMFLEPWVEHYNFLSKGDFKGLFDFLILNYKEGFEDLMNHFHLIHHPFSTIFSLIITIIIIVIFSLPVLAELLAVYGVYRLVLHGLAAFIPGLKRRENRKKKKSKYISDNIYGNIHSLDEEFSSRMRDAGKEAEDDFLDFF